MLNTSGSSAASKQKNVLLGEVPPGSVRCPYIKQHVMHLQSFMSHLNRCKATNKHQFRTCLFNNYHIVHYTQLQEHLKSICQEQKQIEQEQDDEVILNSVVESEPHNSFSFSCSLDEQEKRSNLQRSSQSSFSYSSSDSSSCGYGFYQYYMQNNKNEDNYNQQYKNNNKYDPYYGKYEENNKQVQNPKQQAKGYVNSYYDNQQYDGGYNNQYETGYGNYGNKFNKNNKYNYYYDNNYDYSSNNYNNDSYYNFFSKYSYNRNNKAYNRYQNNNQLGYNTGQDYKDEYQNEYQDEYQEDYNQRQYNFTKNKTQNFNRNNDTNNNPNLNKRNNGKKNNNANNNYVHYPRNLWNKNKVQEQKLPSSGLNQNKNMDRSRWLNDKSSDKSSIVDSSQEKINPGFEEAKTDIKSSSKSSSRNKGDDDELLFFINEIDQNMKKVCITKGDDQLGDILMDQASIIKYRKNDVSHDQYSFNPAYRQNSSIIR